MSRKRSYIPVDFTRGWSLLSSVKNFQFKNLEEEDFFVEPWEDRDRRDCALFGRPGSKEALEVLFFSCEGNLFDFFKKTMGSLYLYGAYGQINVLQIRSKGVIIKERDLAQRYIIRDHIRAGIRNRLERPGNEDKLKASYAHQLFEIINKGRLFSFKPERFDISSYQRG